MKPENFTVANVLATLSVIILITDNLYRFLHAISVIKVSLSCFERIQKFMDLHESQGSSVELGRRGIARVSSRNTTSAQDAETTRGNFELQASPKNSQSGKAQVSIRSGFISLKAPKFVLQNINLHIETSSLTLVVGPVASGKTVLLRALIEDIDLVSGDIVRPSNGIAYCSQHPFLWKSTLRANILGESPWDQQWYNSVLKACALQEVVARMPAGDSTNVGNHGSVLSGGQQQRVALARALYSHKSLLVLDDPLSGLDRNTQSFVLDHVFGTQGLCRRAGLTVVMATSHASHVAFADQVVTLGHSDASVRVTRSDEISEAWNSISSFEEHTASNAPVPIVGPQDLPADEDEGSATNRGCGDSQLYVRYIRSMGYTCFISKYWCTRCWRMITDYEPFTLAFFILNALLAFFTVFPQKWLQLWAASFENKSIATNNALYISVYATLAVSGLIALGASIAYWLIYAVPRSASSLHMTLLQAVMRAPYNWLLMTNTGKTINRFSQDMSLVDVTLPIAALQSTIAALNCIGGLIFLVLGSVWLAIAIPFILGVLYVLQSVYLRTSRQLRLLDLEAKSPLYTHYGETIDGLATIRAYGWKHQYISRGMKLLDHSQSPYYLLYCAQRWLNFVLDMTVAGIATLLVAIGFALRHTSTVNGGSIGVALVNIIGFNQSLALLVQNWTLLETSLGAIARISDLVANTPAENPRAEIGGSPELPHSAMSVQFHDVTAKANSESTNFILKNVNLLVSPGQKTALVGPSGSGKSSILLALTGLLHLESGQILLDGHDVTTFERDAIRQKIAIMSQDAPVLPGTIRFNLDPLGLVNNPATILGALAKVGLVVKLPGQDGIEAPFTQLNLSTGEMQLFRFAAVLLSNAKLVLLDEVTSSLDAATEREIMRLIEEELRDRTIVTVAHRLNTILDYDQVIVVDGGGLAEVGRPRELLESNSSRFARMCRE